MHRRSRPLLGPALLALTCVAALLAMSCGAAVTGGASTPAPRRPPARTAAAARAAVSATAASATATAAPAAAASAPVAPAGAATAAPTLEPAPATPTVTPSPPTPTPTATAAATPQASATPVASSDYPWTDAVSPTAIPIGDGNVSNVPLVGYVDSCTFAFRGGGAQHDGPWIVSGAGTWNQDAKLAVLGEHTWPNAYYRESIQGGTRVIEIGAVPVGLRTGTFPIAPSDPAYQYDRNPNAIAAQSLTYRLPANPTAAAAPSCTTLGVIGVTTVGVVLFNALDDAGRDAGAHEVQDACHGHPNGGELYHYHSISSCLEHAQPNSSMLVGYAMDGYGIYAEWNAAGSLPTNADLDACHGRTSRITWNGQSVTMYHYDVTLEYPYTVGCFHGTPIVTGPPPRP